MKLQDEVLNYLDALPEAERNCLGKLRAQILEIEPTMQERLSRGVPFFYFKGKRAVGFRSSKLHLSFFIMEGNVLKDLQNELAGYDYSATVIRFQPENPLPGKLIGKLVKARISEIEK